jgi:hypothetical protein
MSNGKIIPPDLDDRNWQKIVAEAQALIPQYAPEWTDHNPGDLGITLIELFAWMVEGMIYRLNRVPEKNYLAFLNLLGITRDPPTPAEADITFKIGDDSVVTVPPGTQVSTSPGETEEGIVFETEHELNAVNLQKCLFRLGLDDHDYTIEMTKEPFASVVLTISPPQDGTLFLGFKKSTTRMLTLTFRISEVNPPDSVKWTCSTDFQPEKWEQITPTMNQTYNFSASGTVGLSIPAKWKDVPLGLDPTPQRFYWIGIHFKNFANKPVSFRLERAAANIVRAVNTLTVRKEFLGKSTGEPFQVFALKKNPLYQDVRAEDPLNHLVISVKENAAAEWEDWTWVEDFDPGNGKQYRCNPVTGEISFGNYLPQISEEGQGSNSSLTGTQTGVLGPTPSQGSGRIPPQGSELVAKSYRYVAGQSEGNVAAQTIKIHRGIAPGVLAVTNEQKAFGGSDWEKLEETMRRAPQSLKIRDRAVTAEDYEYLVRRASTDVAKVRCFPPRKENPYQFKNEPFDRSPGKVNLIIVPDDRPARQPAPTTELIAEINRYLDARRTLTSILVAPWPPFYVEIKVARATVFVDPGKDTEMIKMSIQQRLYEFLHPLTGGPEGKGWEIGQDLFLPDVFKVIEAIAEVRYVQELKLGALSGDVQISGMRVSIPDYQLICAAELSDENYNVEVKWMPVDT